MQHAEDIMKCDLGWSEEMFKKRLDVLTTVTKIRRTSLLGLEEKREKAVMMEGGERKIGERRKRGGCIYCWREA